MLKTYCKECKNTLCPARSSESNAGCEVQDPEYLLDCGHSSSFLHQPEPSPHCKRLDLYVHSAAFCTCCKEIAELKARVARIVVEKSCGSCEHSEIRDWDGNPDTHPCVGCEAGKTGTFNNWQQRKDGG